MLNVLVVCTAVLVGLLVGWWLRGAAPGTPQLRQRSDDAVRAREILERLRELTRNVAADVDQHKALMGRITDELHATEEREPATVLKAVDRLIRSNEQMQAQLSSAEARLATQARQLVSHAVEARTDSLTALANRRAFDQAMNQACADMAQQGAPATIMMIDIDRFKQLNDTYGHQAGDAVLRSVAQVLRQRIPEEHLVARYGGEEFAVIFARTTVEQIERLAEHARRAGGEGTIEFAGLTLRVTVSSGMAQLLPGESAASVIGRSDDALYVSKAQGRNCGHVHTGRRVVAVGQTAPAEKGTPAARTRPAPMEVGISSPQVFSSDVRRRLAEWKTGGTPLCLLFVQIDDLEQIRAQHGDDNGDAAVRALTLTLKAAMREMDHAARFDGDTLSLLLPGCTMRGAAAVAENLRTGAARCELSSRYTCRQFTVSIGIGEALEDEQEDDLIERVRSSLHVARLHGRDCTYLHDGIELHLIGVGRLSMAT
jgi:diguanylate cyclase